MSSYFIMISSFNQQQSSFTWLASSGDKDEPVASGVLEGSLYDDHKRIQKYQNNKVINKLFMEIPRKITGVC